MADAYQYFEASSYKIYFVKLSYSALEKVIVQYQENEKMCVEKVYKDALTKGKGEYKNHNNYIDYFGTQVAPTVMMDKLTMEIMSLLHNFFDTFAQWINSSLLAEDGVLMEKVSLSKVVRKLASFPEYSGPFINNIKELTSSREYKYISDFNNTLKHRRQIYIDNKFDILSIKGSVSVPRFIKDGRLHIKEDVLVSLKEKIDFCNDLINSSKSYVENYYASSDNLHVKHRLENPDTYLTFESKEDFEAMKFPKSHYYYIEVDPSRLLNEYHFILCYDRMNGSQDESIEFFNSPYSIIMIRERGTQNIIGILKPKDEEIQTINDARELTYRKYSVIRTDYEEEMFTSIFSEDAFQCYLGLSKINIIYESSKSEMVQEL